MVVDGDDLSGATLCWALGGMIMLTGRAPVLAPRLGREVRLAGVGEMSADGFIDTTRALLLLGVCICETAGREAVERARDVVTLLPRPVLLFLLLATLVPAAVDAESERREPATEVSVGGRVPIDGLLGVPRPETRRAAKPGDWMDGGGLDADDGVGDGWVAIQSLKRGDASCDQGCLSQFIHER